ncbi:hypothetical protein ACQXXV_07405 [Corynebacterium diphtheriae]
MDLQQDRIEVADDPARQERHKGHPSTGHTGPDHGSDMEQERPCMAGGRRPHGSRLTALHRPGCLTSPQGEYKPVTPNPWEEGVGWFHSPSATSVSRERDTIPLGARDMALQRVADKGGEPQAQ